MARKTGESREAMSRLARYDVACCSALFIRASASLWRSSKRTFATTERKPQGVRFVCFVLLSACFLVLLPRRTQRTSFFRLSPLMTHTLDDLSSSAWILRSMEIHNVDRRETSSLSWPALLLPLLPLRASVLGSPAAFAIRASIDVMRAQEEPHVQYSSLQA